jgi:YtkA-like
MLFVSRGSRQKICRLPKMCVGLIVFAVILAGCSKHRDDESSPGLAIKHEISPDPPHVGAANLTLKLADATGLPITKARVALEADMQHPGMVPHSYPVKELDPGRYQAQVQFDMAGDWIILLHVILPDGNSLDRQFDVKGVRSK